MEEQPSQSAEEVVRQLASSQSNNSQQSLISENSSVRENENTRKIWCKKLFSLSWSACKKNSKFFLSVMFLYVLLRIFQVVANTMAEGDMAVSLAVIAAFFVINIFIGIGFMRIFLKISRGSAANVEELFGERKYFWKFLGGSLLYGLIVAGGYLLLIIPGIIWAYKYSMFGYLIIDKDMTPSQALKESGRITQGHKGELFIMQLCIGLLYLVGLLCLGVGLLVAVVMGGLMNVYAYRTLMGEMVNE